MRQRLTFLHDANADYDIKSLKVTKSSATIKGLKAAREDRLTFDLQELPQELRTALVQCQSLSVRWTSSEKHPIISPFVSSISPGLHVFITPKKLKSPDAICNLLKKVLGSSLKCATLEETFIDSAAAREDPTSSHSLQYYHILPSSKDLVTYIQRAICRSGDASCQSRAAALESATSLDVNYDIQSRRLVCFAQWTHGPNDGAWDEDIVTASKKDRVEVGVLAIEEARLHEELSLGGWLTVIGQDSKPSPTLFSFPSRHHPLPVSDSSSFSVSFPPPTGLHPTLRIIFPSAPAPPPVDGCSLYTYVTLPSYLFADPYQLSDPLFLASKNLQSIPIIDGETDLEAPNWIIKKWGSTVLAQIATSTSSDHSTSVHSVEIPLHLRYLEPRQGHNGQRSVSVPWPVVFWACPLPSQSDASLDGNPFDRINLGYDRLFPANSTLFYHLNPRPASSSNATTAPLMETLAVPVLDLEYIRGVETGTIAVVLLGFCWICWRLFVMPRVTLDASDSVPVSTTGQTKKKTT